VTPTADLLVLGHCFAVWFAGGWHWSPFVALQVQVQVQVQAMGMGMERALQPKVLATIQE
jgi:hypothetical protein